MAKLYEFAVLFNPPKTVNGQDNTDKPKVIVQPQTLLADSDSEAQIKAARAIPEEFIDRLDQVEIALRPF